MRLLPRGEAKWRFYDLGVPQGRFLWREQQKSRFVCKLFLFDRVHTRKMLISDIMACLFEPRTVDTVAADRLLHQVRSSSLVSFFWFHRFGLELDYGG